ncbi:DNA adenine methylase [Halomonas sp. MCCC 1A11036]|uniref:DNA adenine methylase n=1 Tax=Billgrantia zhangzhouensis TaxID=2733481 RepID=A0ABS9AGP3_9GAMM|nr:DNA adenine methylase [Halomonas zhangzhouensis]MCE8020889.1 DNA adenine methylase [Halomonas zhangzhouensis]
MSRNKTPLRYPGGKQKLTPFIREIILSNGLDGGHYIEPYAGGAGVAMELLVSGDVEHVHLNDSSYHIYCFWSAILNFTEEFCNKISSCVLNIEEWLVQREILRNPENHTLIEVGFATFYLNRTNRSGVLGGGVIGGLSQNGKWKLDARFSKRDLIERIEVIASLKHAVSLYNKDAEIFFSNDVKSLPEKSLIYIDPPYFNKSNRLYLNHYKPGDHERIAGVVQEMERVKWIVSYDAVDEIMKYYSNRRSFVYDLQYNASRAYKGKEVFIFSDGVVVPRNSAISYINFALKRESKNLHFGVQ